MLGLHANPRGEDSVISQAELTFRATLSLPAAFIATTEAAIPDVCGSPSTPQHSSAATALFLAMQMYVRAAPVSLALFPANQFPANFII
jgi:hypothetical protein